MLVHRAYKYELDPNNHQRTSFRRHAGVARFVYNWGLAHRIKIFKEEEGEERFTNAMKQRKLLNSLKNEQFPWMYDCSKCAPEESLRDLDRAFRNFYRGLKTSTKIGFPRFKRKGVKDKFKLTGVIRIEGRKIQLPRIGKIRIKECKETYYLGRILSATVSRRANRWFVSITVEEEIPEPSILSGPSIGVDLGIKSLATLSNGIRISNPRALERKIRKLRKLSKRLSRKKMGSKNREKARLQLAKTHMRISNIRQDSLHKLTTHLAKNHSKIVIEDLHVSGMMKNHHLARAISDVGMYEFRRQLEYKCKWYGSKLIIVQRNFPSSKKCSNCGYRKKRLSLSEREFVCEECGIRIDRDLNAAINLVTVSLPETQTACGENVRLPMISSEMTSKQISMKQEPNIRPNQ
ncbi:MAG: RNA-guided endonuclease TnpB family protein [Candidatus Thorarchaeota archaeon]